MIEVYFWILYRYSSCLESCCCSSSCCCWGDLQKRL